MNRRAARHERISERERSLRSRYGLFRLLQYGHRHLRYGFTLLELLVVIAIIALLAAILVPSLRKARDQTKRLVCQSNLHQLMIAWNSYLEEHKGNFFYRSVNANVNYGGKQGSSAMCTGPKPLNKHVKLPEVTSSGADIYCCPSDTGSDMERPTLFDYNGSSYGTNLLVVGNLSIHPLDPCRPVLQTAKNRQLPMKLQKINVNLSKLVFMADWGWLATWHYSSNRRIEWHGRAESHNLAFLDGHVSFSRLHKCMHVSSDYTIIPFADLQATAIEKQKHANP